MNQPNSGGVKVFVATVIVAGAFLLAAALLGAWMLWAAAGIWG